MIRLQTEAVLWSMPGEDMLNARVMVLPSWTQEKPHMLRCKSLAPTLLSLNDFKDVQDQTTVSTSGAGEENVSLQRVLIGK